MRVLGQGMCKSRPWVPECLLTEKMKKRRKAEKKLEKEQPTLVQAQRIFKDIFNIMGNG